MKVRVPVAALLAALKQVKRGVVRGKTSLPVLKACLLEVREGVLTVTTTDLDCGCRVHVMGAEVEEGTFSVVTHHGILLDLTKRLPTHAMAELVPHQSPLDKGESVPALRITVGRFTTDVLQMCHADEWPILPELTAEELETRLKPGVVATAAGVSVMASREEARPILNGIFAEFGSGVLRLTGTNGHRMITRCEWLEPDVTGAYILPPKLVRVADALFDARDGAELRIGTAHRPSHLDGVVPPVTPESTRYLWLRQGPVTLWGRCIEGPYPNYRSVHPDPLARKGVALVDRVSMLSAVQRVASMASSQTRRVRFTFNGLCHVDAETVDVGRATEVIEGVTYNGEPIVIGFNAKYLEEMLLATGCERIKVELWAPERAILIRPELDPSTTGLLMPLRLLD